MSTPLHIVLVEDRDEDAEMMERELRKTGLFMEVDRVQDRAAYERAVVNADMVITDHSLPAFSGVDALRIALNRPQPPPPPPVILCTGSLDEETAVSYIKAGAVDYVLKDKLDRLGIAVLAAIEADSRLRQRAALHQVRTELDAAETRITELEAEKREAETQ